MDDKTIKKISQLLGAEYVGTVAEVGGYPGIKTRICGNDIPCAIDAFFRHEAKKPAHLRKNYCHIACRCRKCNPIMM